MSTVYIGGTFDGLHEGHKELIDIAIKIAGKEGEVFFALNSDDFVQRHKGIKLMHDVGERYMALRDYASALHEKVMIGVVICDDDQQKLLDVVRPHFVLHGDDWNDERIYDRYKINREWLQERGITLLYKGRYPGVSSTQLREAKQHG